MSQERTCETMRAAKRLWPLQSARNERQPSGQGEIGGLELLSQGGRPSRAPEGMRESSDRGAEESRGKGEDKDEDEDEGRRGWDMG